jgi:arginyl-tRNA synthetase
VAGELPTGAEVALPAGLLFRPASPRRSGVVADWVTPVAQRWAAELGQPSRAPALARALAPGLFDQDDVATVEVAPSGLLALTLENPSRARVVEVVRSDPETYAVGEGGRHRPVLERAGWRRLDDPLRPVQLAHARLCRLLRNGEALGVRPGGEDRLAELHHVDERHLLVALADLPQRLDAHAGDLSASGRAVAEVASLADRWHQPTAPTRRGDDAEPVHGVRLLLADAARIVLRNGLGRLGAAAPERM